MLQHDQATQPTRPSNGRVKMNTYTQMTTKNGKLTYMEKEV